MCNAFASNQTSNFIYINDGQGNFSQDTTSALALHSGWTFGCAFGDYNNDIEMLLRSKYSFAMENAHPRVKEIAQYRAKSNNEYGVELVLKTLIESKQIN